MKERLYVKPQLEKIIIYGFNVESFTFVDTSLMTSAFAIRKGKPAMFSYKQCHFTFQPRQNFL